MRITAHYPLRVYDKIFTHATLIVRTAPAWARQQWQRPLPSPSGEVMRWQRRVLFFGELTLFPLSLRPPLNQRGLQDKQWMANHSLLKLLKRRVRGDTKVASKGVA